MPEKVESTFFDNFLQI